MMPAEAAVVEIRRKPVFVSHNWRRVSYPFRFHDL